MLTITVNNSMSRIEGFTREEFEELKKILSYREDARKSRFGWRSPVRYLIDKKGNFPTGLLYLVINWTSGKKITWCDNRIPPKINPMGLETLFLPGTAPTPYPEQIEAAEAAKRFIRGIITAPTGSGKSLIAALICDVFKVKTLIVVPSLELKKQLTASLSQWFGKDKVGPKEQDKLIIVENVDALSERPIPGVHLLIIDEFHRSGAKTYRNLNKKAWNNIYFKIGLTATPFRSNENERLLLESVLSHVIHRIEYSNSVKNQRIVPLEAYYYELPKQEIQGNETNWASVYSEMIVHNEIRNDLIINLINSLKEQDAPTLTLVKEIKHGEMLSKATGVPFANGESDNTRELILMFNLGEIKSLIGTIGVLGEGIDTKPAEWIIMAGGGKSKNQFMQNCGRAFRTYPGKESAKIIMFCDKSHKWLLTHFKTCCKYLLEEYGVKAVKL